MFQNGEFIPGANPKMHLMDKGAVAVVQFEDAISAISIAPGDPIFRTLFISHHSFSNQQDTTFQETLPLKDPWHRILGFGSISSDDQLDQVSLIVITANSGLLSFNFDLAKIRKSNPEYV